MQKSQPLETDPAYVLRDLDEAAVKNSVLKASGLLWRSSVGVLWCFTSLISIFLASPRVEKWTLVKLKPTMC